MNSTYKSLNKMENQNVINSVNAAQIEITKVLYTAKVHITVAVRVMQPVAMVA
jgi:hypothetical protein